MKPNNTKLNLRRKSPCSPRFFMYKIVNQTNVIKFSCHFFLNRQHNQIVQSILWHSWSDVLFYRLRVGKTSFRSSYCNRIIDSWTRFIRKKIALKKIKINGPPLGEEALGSCLAYLPLEPAMHASNTCNS